eukprot:658296_1
MSSTSENIRLVHNSTQQHEPLLSAIMYMICFMAQSIIMLHCYVKMRKRLRKISKVIRHATVAVLVFTWISILFDIIISILDLAKYTPIDSASYCVWVYWLRYLRPILFELCLSVFWTIRLNHTFKFSALEISRRTFSIILSVIVIISFILSILLILLLYDMKLEAIDYVQSSFGNSCCIHWNTQLLSVLLASQLLVVLQNIGFSNLFWVKLRDLHKIVLKTRDASSFGAQRVEKTWQLQQKHTLLATIPISVTIVVYTLFDIGGYSRLPLYFLINIDMIMKCLCMLLFYRFYLRQFGFLCSLCIRGVGSANEELFSYFNPKMEDHRPTIFAAVKKANIAKQSMEPDESEDEYNEDASHSPKLYITSQSQSREDDQDVTYLEYDEDDNGIDNAPLSPTRGCPSSPTYLRYTFSGDGRIIDPKEHSQACQWIEHLVDVKFTKQAIPETDGDEDIDILYEQDAFFDQLRDGLVLCQLLNTIKPNTCENYKESTNSHVQRANINIFLNGCRKLGINQINIFDTNDLYEMKRVSAVLKCIFAVSAKAKDFPCYDGPTIGYKFSTKNERHFSQSTMNKGKSAVPFFSRAAKVVQSNEVYGIVRIKQEEEPPPEIDHELPIKYLSIADAKAEIGTDKEKFLNAADFRQVFEMDRSVFYTLPQWKQKMIKKNTGFF